MCLYPLVVLLSPQRMRHKYGWYVPETILLIHQHSTTLYKLSWSGWCRFSVNELLGHVQQILGWVFILDLFHTDGIIPLGKHFRNISIMWGLLKNSVVRSPTPTASSGSLHLLLSAPPLEWCHHSAYYLSPILRYSYYTPTHILIYSSHLRSGHRKMEDYCWHTSSSKVLPHFINTWTVSNEDSPSRNCFQMFSSGYILFIKSGKKTAKQEL